MGEFNSDDHYIYYSGQESLRSNGAALIVNKIQTAVCGWNLKSDRMISIPFQGKPVGITVIQVYVAIINTKEAKLKLNGSKKTYENF